MGYIRSLKFVADRQAAIAFGFSLPVINAVVRRSREQVLVEEIVHVEVDAKLLGIVGNATINPEIIGQGVFGIVKNILGRSSGLELVTQREFQAL